MTKQKIHITEPNEYLKKLEERIYFMHNVRHKAAKRLDSHKMLSTWTLALLAIAVIILEMQTQYEQYFCFNTSPQTMNIMQIIFSVMTLAYSLLLSKSNYSVKSMRMFNCAKKLGSLKREAEILLCSSNNIPSKNITLISNKYDDIMNECENHSDLDFLIAKTETTCYFSKNICRHIHKYVLFVTTYFHYYVLIILVYGWILYNSNLDSINKGYEFTSRIISEIASSNIYTIISNAIAGGTLNIIYLIISSLIFYIIFFTLVIFIKLTYKNSSNMLTDESSSAPLINRPNNPKEF